jgi:4-coumarate--CoA ligase
MYLWDTTRIQPPRRTVYLPTDGFVPGDVGYRDRDGTFYITNRVKELIKYKGSQVAPTELEGTILDHEAIDDVAVMGVETEVHGSEVPRAYIVLNVKRRAGLRYQGDENSVAKETVSWLEGRVAPHKRLRGGVLLVHANPKSVTYKILPRILKAKAKAEEESSSKANV